MSALQYFVFRVPRFDFGPVCFTGGMFSVQPYEPDRYPVRYYWRLSLSAADSGRMSSEMLQATYVQPKLVVRSGHRLCLRLWGCDGAHWMIEASQVTILAGYCTLVDSFHLNCISNS